jgi:hypothetical protein
LPCFSMRSEQCQQHTPSNCKQGPLLQQRALAMLLLLLLRCHHCC